MGTISEQVSAATLSQAERLHVAGHLEASRDALLGALTDLTDAQWHFKLAEGQWSIAEILEHLSIIENRVHAVIVAMPEGAPAGPDHVNAEVEERLLQDIPDRRTKIVGPALVAPTGQCSPQEALGQFLAAREQTVQMMETAAALRGRVRLHPILGPLDGYQWLLAVALHTRRHTSQIQEVKNCSGFPKSGGAGNVTSH